MVCASDYRCHANFRSVRRTDFIEKKEQIEQEKRTTVSVYKEQKDKTKYIVTESFQGNRQLTEIIGNMILSDAKNAEN